MGAGTKGAGGQRIAPPSTQSGKGGGNSYVPNQATNPYAAQNQNTVQNQLPRTTFQSQYGMPQPYMGGKGMGYRYQPSPYTMGSKGMGYGYQPSYNPYATQSPYVNYNQPSYGSIGGKGGSMGGKGGTAGGKGG